MPLKAIWSPQTTGFPRLSTPVLILPMAIWSPCDKNPGAGHCSMATLRGASCRCARPNTASGIPNWQASGCASGLPANTTGSFGCVIAASIAGSHWAGLMNSLQSLYGHRPGDGLPKRAVVKATPILSDFVDTYWDDLSRVWKASTTKRNWNAWKTVIAPAFGAMRVADILPADIHRWRDDCAGTREGLFNRALPVLAALLKYAEALRLRRKGSNPCRGMPRYWREPKERYLTPAEYRRIGAALREQEAAYPAQVALVRLLLFTGARVGEILNLRWEWVQPPRLLLPDSKTGAKTIWLNSQALEVLKGIERHEDTTLVFPNRSRTRPLNFDNWWLPFRAGCALPDVRVHDLRHSFASTAIMDNVPLATIGRLLGHVLPETTAKYAHLSDDVIGDAADRIAGSLAQAIGLGR
jgi:integrase